MLTILNSLVLLTVKIIVRRWVVYFFATQCISSNITAICASQHRVLLTRQNVFHLIRCEIHAALSGVCSAAGS